ncbi:hypothetical protein lerEdw1_013080 [Lerista edwardsae]|nr:hypothetical protein lerEdw1_013080 [Lerista edwardsae]
MKPNNTHCIGPAGSDLEGQVDGREEPSLRAAPHVLTEVKAKGRLYLRRDDVTVRIPPFDQNVGPRAGGRGGSAESLVRPPPASAAEEVLVAPPPPFPSWRTARAAGAAAGAGPDPGRAADGQRPSCAEPAEALASLPGHVKRGRARTTFSRRGGGMGLQAAAAFLCLSFWPLLGLPVGQGVSLAGKALFVTSAFRSPVVCTELVPNLGSVFVKTDGSAAFVTQVCKRVLFSYQ